MFPRIILISAIILSFTITLESLKDNAQVFAYGDKSRRVGIVDFIQNGSRLVIRGVIKNLTVGLHGLHIHEQGDLGNGCNATGRIFDPFNETRFGIRPAGYLGNINVTENGTAAIEIISRKLSIQDLYKVTGHALVVHAEPSPRNFSWNNNIDNAGVLIACGIIERRDNNTSEPDESEYLESEEDDSSDSEEEDEMR